MADAIDFPGSNFTFKEELVDVNRTGCVFLSVMSNRIFFPVIVGSEEVVRSVVADLGQVWDRGEQPTPKPRRFEAKETAKGWTVFHTPPPVRHEDGSVSLKLGCAVLIMGDYIEDPEGVAQRVADILEANWDAANG